MNLCNLDWCKTVWIQSMKQFRPITFIINDIHSPHWHILQLHSIIIPLMMKIWCVCVCVYDVHTTTTHTHTQHHTTTPYHTMTTNSEAPSLPPPSLPCQIQIRPLPPLPHQQPSTPSSSLLMPQQIGEGSVIYSLLHSLVSIFFSCIC